MSSHSDMFRLGGFKLEMVRRGGLGQKRQFDW